MQTNHDVLVIEPFHKGAEPISYQQIQKLKYKYLGSRRLVFAVMDLTHADRYSYYWEREWRPGSPPWLLQPTAENPDRYRVEYWRPGWREIVGYHFKGLMDLEFDGVILTGLDAFRPFEQTILEKIEDKGMAFRLPEGAEWEVNRFSVP